MLRTFSRLRPVVTRVVLHVTPVLLGRGMRLFGAARAGLRCIETVHGAGAVHLRYEVG
jgi:hypothetical protein